jgi:hypothetical protein
VRPAFFAASEYGTSFLIGEAGIECPFSLIFGIADYLGGKDRETDEKWLISDG